MKKFEVNYVQDRIHMTVYVEAYSAAQAKSFVISHEGRVKFKSVKEVEQA